MAICIVAVGYNRPDSLKNLCDSLLRARYCEPVDLLISIDKGPRQQQVIDIANSVAWPYGEKKVRAFDERQGLRSHILQCGDITDDYEAVIVLEDDLEVSPCYFDYAKQMISAYANDDRIAGISLYKHLFHPGVCRPFEPENNGLDVYLMQYAMSWGQCWTKSMWRGFKAWYSVNKDLDLGRDCLLPSYVSSWNEQSWLKYYMRYVVECKKYFVYPQISLSTNASELGEHCRFPNSDYQVPLLTGFREFKLADFDSLVRYDVFFEREGFDASVLGLHGELSFDLYGCRSEYSGFDYVVTPKILPYKVVKTVQLHRRPIEANVIFPAEGEGLFVYDLSIPSNSKTRKVNLINTRYDIRGVHWRRLLPIIVQGLRQAVSVRLKK